ncbi:MAG: hypothetical protein AB7O50_00495 [Pseudolabrys sp.]
MAFIGRFFVVGFALMLASLAAGAVVSLGLLGPEWRTLSGDPFERATFWTVTLFASGIAWFTGFLPMVIAVVLAEAFKIRSLLVYATASSALFVLGALGGGFVNAYEESIDRAPALVPPGLQLAAAAGIAFGLIYWLIAGRRAGAWCEQRAPTPSA